MDAHDDTSVAYTYAWWLTGDEAAAGDAARTAVSSAAVADAPAGQRLAVLLAEVRSAAAPTPTMCPASEIALLHDAHGVPLDQVGELVGVDPADARTELAHGRIEALTQTIIDPSVHPERLGGLAVGNPADVAHARQCVSCGHARVLLERGRNELRTLAVVPVPEGLTARGGRPGRLTGTRRLAAVVLLAVAAAAVALLLAGRGAPDPDPEPGDSGASVGEATGQWEDAGGLPRPRGESLDERRVASAHRQRAGHVRAGVAVAPRLEEQVGELSALGARLCQPLMLVGPSSVKP